MTDFGTVAVGTRLHNLEPSFFTSWTALLSGWLRPGDNVLRIGPQEPAHKAADRLVRGFLQSDNNTLFMVDDDMVFPADALERLRSNEDNWPYDIVMALCTTRGVPPMPVILRELPEQPDPPQCWEGEHFERVFEWEDGEVIEVGSVGLAFTLIRRPVLAAMRNLQAERDLDHCYFFRYGEGVETEDIPFCREARRLGFRLAIDTSVKIGHLSRVVLGYQQFKSWYEASKDGDRAEAEVPAR